MNNWISTRDQLPKTETVLFIDWEGQTFLGWRNSKGEWNTAPTSYVFSDEQVKWWQPSPSHPIDQDIQAAFDRAYHNLVSEIEKTEVTGTIVEAALRELQIEIQPFRALVLYTFFLNSNIDDLSKSRFMRFIDRYQD